MTELIKKGEFAYEAYQNKATREGYAVDVYQKIAELIEDDLAEIWFEDSQFEESRACYKEDIIKGVAPLKIEIAKYIKEHELEVLPAYTKEVELFKKLGSKSIAGVITTNYDEFIEKHLSGYATYIGQDELIFSNIQGVGEVYKIHGCCTKPESIIIDEKDYMEFEERNAYLAAKILTIFLEHPIIFLGYSLGDKNIQSILNAIAKCLSAEKLELLKQRLIFIEWNNNGNEDSISTHSINFGGDKSLEMIKVSIKDFDLLYEVLLENKFTYKTSVLRRIKEQLYELVLSNDPKEKLRVVGITEDDKLEDIEVVVGVGVISQFGQKGYLGLTVADLIEDVLFDDRAFEAEFVVAQSLPTLLSHHGNSIPIHKYISQISGTIPERVKDQIKTRYDEFLSRTIRNNKARGTYDSSSLQEVINENVYSKALKIIPLLPKENIICEELGDFLRKVYLENPKILSEGTSSDFRRLVRIYDWMKYK